MTEAGERNTRERRTLTVSGRRTTVSLEQEIWRSLNDVADRERVPLTFIADEVDRRREDASLASGLRVFCLFYWRLLADARMGDPSQVAPGLRERPDPTDLILQALTLMAQGGRHRAREALTRPRGRFGKPV
ncbi:MAG: ribbon-helix-helix domain-containing protein [Elsteraceae bacterium]